MKKQEFKNKVLNWIKENDIDISDKKIRVYKYRNEWEVRIYDEPMEIENHRKSIRKSDESSTGYYRGYFTRKISTYIHINESDFKNENEKKFILECLKHN